MNNMFVCEMWVAFLSTDMLPLQPRNLIIRGPTQTLVSQDVGNAS